MKDMIKIIGALRENGFIVMSMEKYTEAFNHYLEPLKEELISRDKEIFQLKKEIKRLQKNVRVYK